MLRITPRRWTSQPQTPVGIDWSNPITQGLVFAFNPALGVWDAVSSTALFTLTGAQGVGPSGITRVQTGSQKSWNAGPVANGAANITQWQRIRRTGTVSSNANAFGKNFQTNGSPSFISWCVAYNPNSAGQNTIQAAQGIAGSIVNGSNYAHPDATQWHDVAIVKPTGLLNLYVGGVNVASDSAGAIAYGSSGNNDVAANPSGVTAPFDFGPGFLWNRALSPAEIASLSANPWQIFSPALC